MGHHSPGPNQEGGTMNRRQFLRYSLACGAFVAARDIPAWSQSSKSPGQPAQNKTLPKGVRIIDAHAHPDRYVHDLRQVDETSTLKAILGLGMAASSFAAIGDSVFLGRDRIPGTEYGNTKSQLEWWLKGIVKSGKARMVLKSSDVPEVLDPKTPPGVILTIEGGDPLEKKIDRVDEFYRLGVRMITLLHYRNNDLGDTMRGWSGLNPGPMQNGLTPTGRKVVERMHELGMVVDLAHAHTKTLKGVVEISSKPLIDSHTNPCVSDDPEKCGRFRTWKDMELVAKGGGVVCTWPLRDGTRKTFRDWAEEIVEMKKRLGMEHVGLGTDGGGGLPSLIEGYKDVRDLTKLAAAMQEAGLSPEDISAYMGGNFLRVLQTCIG
jgi:membrane dipeptidase